MQLTIPRDDFAEFSALPEAVKDEVRIWMAELQAVTPPIQAALAQLARKLAVSTTTARRRYDAVRSEGWRGLVNRAKAPTEVRRALHPATIEHFGKLAGLNQRASRPAYRALVRSFLAGEMIPGIPEDMPRHELPKGWSYGNFMRNRPSDFELTALRQGRSAARSLAPLVYTTRRNLWVGSHYVFDDMVHDHFVNVLDTAKTGRPLEFHCLDLNSACKFAWGIKVRTEDELTGRMDGLKLEQMLGLTCKILRGDGYHAELGTTFMVEHGTAAIPEWYERLLSDLSGGKIKVARGGIEGDPAHVGQYAGRGRGNFRFKAALESAGGLYHNEMGFLPGQTGLGVERRPEESHGLLKANDALLEAFTALRETRPDLAAALRLPLMGHTQFLEVALAIYSRINRRTEHELEGWDLRVVPDERNPMRMRRMSPWEVWQAGRPALTRFGDHQISVLLYSEERAKPRTVANGMISFQDAELGTGLHRFDAHRLLPDGEKAGAIVSPCGADGLYLYDARGRYLGFAPAVQRADRADAEALKRKMGEVNKVLAERLAPVAALGREIAEQRLADARHNAEVLGQYHGVRRHAVEARAARAGAAVARDFQAADVGRTDVVEESMETMPGALSEAGAAGIVEDEIHLG